MNCDDFCEQIDQFEFAKCENHDYNDFSNQIISIRSRNDAKIMFYEKFSIETNISCSSEFKNKKRKTNISYSNEFQIKRKIKNSIDFWQREIIFTNNFVFVFDCVLAIINEIANKKNEKNNFSNDFFFVFDCASNVIVEK